MYTEEDNYRVNTIMLEQSYIKGLEFTQAYTVDDCNYHSNLASSLSEKPVINYKDIYNLQVRTRCLPHSLTLSHLLFHSLRTLKEQTSLSKKG